MRIIPLWCLFAGHKYMPNGDEVNENGKISVKCIWCGEEDEFTVETACKAFGHDFRDGFCIYCQKKVTPKNCPEHDWEIVGVDHFTYGNKIPCTARRYQCKICDAVYGEEKVEDMIEGKWHFVDGKMIHASQMPKKKAKAVQDGETGKEAD